MALLPEPEGLTPPQVHDLKKSSGPGSAGRAGAALGGDYIPRSDADTRFMG